MRLTKTSPLELVLSDKGATQQSLIYGLIKRWLSALLFRIDRETITVRYSSQWKENCTRSTAPEDRRLSAGRHLAGLYLVHVR